MEAGAVRCALTCSGCGCPHTAHEDCGRFPTLQEEPKRPTRGKQEPEEIQQVSEQKPKEIQQVSEQEPKEIQQVSEPKPKEPQGD